MANKQNGVSLAFWIIVVILGVAAFKEIDFENLKFKNTGMGIVYVLTFILSIFLVLRGKKLNK